MSQRTTAQSPPSRSRPPGAVPPDPAAEPGPDTPAAGPGPDTPAGERSADEAAAAGPADDSAPAEPGADASTDTGPAAAVTTDAETTAEVPLPTGAVTSEPGGDVPTPTGATAAESGGAAPASVVGRGRVEFDALYERAAPALIHQVYLLTGRRGDAFDFVEHAFQRAWEHWPEVSHDPDPVGWVRSRAFEHALAPWRRFRRPRRSGRPPADPVHRALLELAPLYRRTVLLCDGVGLTVEEAAAESAASVPATTSRLEHARTALAARLDEPADPEEARERLSALAGAVSTATLPLARSVRTGSERRLRALTGTVFGLTALLAGAVVFSAVTPQSPPPEPAPAPHGSVTDDGAPGRGESAAPGGGPSARPSP
ncbi:hypothetical protein [Streptomyces fradiae]|uniref:RNA polymerase sigma factor n=1 Tax=Streptomyces fradiae TaxID=1906 RepID=UPI0035BE5416